MCRDRGRRALRNCEKMSNVWERYIPLLASPQGGVAASLVKCREATETDAAGVVFLFVLNRKTTPGLALSGGFAIFFDRSATPPCGDARRGIAPADN